MKGVNSVHLIGNLTKDVEVRYSQSGTAIGNFSLAINERRKSGEEWKDFTEYVNVVVFGRTADSAGQHLRKGSPCYVEGRIQTRKWQDKDGNNRYSTEVVANNLVFLGGSRHDDGFPGPGE